MLVDLYGKCKGNIPYINPMGYGRSCVGDGENNREHGKLTGCHHGESRSLPEGHQDLS